MKKQRRITQIPTGCGQTGSSPNQFGEQTWRILRADFSYSPALLMLPFMREKVGRRSPWEKNSSSGCVRTVFHRPSPSLRLESFDIRPGDLELECNRECNYGGHC